MKKSLRATLRLWLRQIQADYRSLQNKLLLWLRPRCEKIRARWLPWQKKLQARWQPQQEKLQSFVRPLFEKYQTRWQALNSREQYTAIAGTLVTTLLLFYALIWSPLTTSLEGLRKQLAREKKTATWMQAADKELRTLEERQNQASLKQLSKRINAVQEDLQQIPLHKNLTQLTQSGPDEIHVVFDPVNFDELITELMHFTEQHHLTIKQASVKRLNGIGLVQAEFVFQVSGVS